MAPDTRRPLVVVPAQAATKPGNGAEATPVQALNRAYVAALQAVGLAPVLLPTRSAPPDDLSWASGLLLPGGADVDPLRYRRDLEPLTEPDPESDQLEFALLDWALRERLPVLAICRGLQVLNVALGGTLVQDLPDHGPRPPLVRDQVAHRLTVVPGSRLQRIVGAETVAANSLHHQGIEQLAAGLSASAYAADGLIEAAEVPGDSFVVGVQYHPEELFSQDPAARSLFQAFASACRDTPSEAAAQLAAAAAVGAV